jgi:hypothetical protein
MSNTKPHELLTEKNEVALKQLMKRNGAFFHKIYQIKQI